MRLLQATRNSLKHASSTSRIARSQSSELPARSGSDRIASRHDTQMFARRAVTADPYAAWLEQREADRERDAHRLNPRDAWDDLRTQSFCAVGR
jgi:hypothetical protein